MFVLLRPAGTAASHHSDKPAWLRLDETSDSSDER